MLGVDTLVLPQAAGFLVVGEGCHPQLLRIEAVAALVLRGGQQLVGVVDGFLFEVVAEGEVAQHLEERAMTGGFTDLVDVQGTHALLVGGHTRVRGGLLTHQIRDERDHTGNGEQRGRVR